MNVFLNVIRPIKDETGLDIEIYSAIGDRVAATDPSSPRLTEEIPVFPGTVMQDERAGTTFFRINVLGARYIGVMTGAGGVSRNYAALVARLIESSCVAIEKPADKTAELRALFAGEYNRTQVEQFCTKYSESRACYVLIFETDDRKNLTEYLCDLAQENDLVFTMTKRSIVMVKDAGGLEEYQSPSDFAYMVAQNAEQEIGRKVFVGIGDCAPGLYGADASYRQAVSALRLGKLLDPKARIYNTKDYFLVSLFEDMPKERIRSFLNSGIDAGLKAIFEDAEMMDTAEQFILGSLNISETARNMYMHRNTLIYRLDKIEKATGLNIRRFSDAMTFRTLSMLYKLNRKEL